MGLKNIFALTIIAVAATACSMEDDLMENTTKAQTEATGAFASLSINVNETKAITKSGESYEGTGYNDGVKSGSLILFNEDETVFQVWDNLTTTGTTIVTGKMQIKLPKGTGSKKVYALFVANTVQTFAGSANLAAVNTKTLTEADMNSNVKVSTLIEATLIGYPTIDDAKNAPATSLTFVVSQLTAKIKLTEFNVTFREGTLPTNVYVEGLTLTNVNYESNLNGDILNTTPKNILYNNGNEFQVWNDAGDNGEAVDFGTPTFSSFANTNAARATEMAFTLNYGDKSKYFHFIINRADTDAPSFTNGVDHAYIKAGYEYQIVINAKLAGETLQCEVKCYTMDWKYEPRLVTLQVMPS